VESDSDYLTALDSTRSEIMVPVLDKAGALSARSIWKSNAWTHLTQQRRRHSKNAPNSLRDCGPAAI